MQDLLERAYEFLGEAGSLKTRARSYAWNFLGKPEAKNRRNIPNSVYYSGAEGKQRKKGDDVIKKLVRDYTTHKKTYN